MAIPVRRARPLLGTIVTPVALSLVLVAAALIGHFSGSRPFNQTMIDLMLRVSMVTALFVFTGNSGVISFGHTGFACLGAYMAAWLTIPPVMKGSLFPGLPDIVLAAHWPYWTAVFAAAAWAGLWALITGRILMRLSGIAASIATFALLAMIVAIYSNWDSVTAGTSSVVGIPILRAVWPYLTLAVLTVFAAWVHAVSRSGLALRAARDEPVAAQASGVNIPRERLIAFTLSGALMGAAGAMFAHSVGVVTPDTFYLSLTFITLSMLVVGGIGSLSGAVIGTVLLSALIQVLRWFEAGVDIGGTAIKLPNGLQEITLGVVMILILMFRPSGIMGTAELGLPRRRQETTGGQNPRPDTIQQTTEDSR